MDIRKKGREQRDNEIWFKGEIVKVRLWYEDAYRGVTKKRKGRSKIKKRKEKRTRGQEDKRRIIGKEILE